MLTLALTVIGLKI